MVNHNDLLADADWVEQSPSRIDKDGSAGKPELEFVEVWENLSTGDMYLLDLEEERIFDLDHIGSRDFMDAALKFEEAVIARQHPGRRSVMQDQVDASSSHRKNRLKTGHGDEHTSLSAAVMNGHGRRGRGGRP